MTAFTQHCRKKSEGSLNFFSSVLVWGVCAYVWFCCFFFFHLKFFYYSFIIHGIQYFHRPCQYVCQTYLTLPDKILVTGSQMTYGNILFHTILNVVFIILYLCHSFSPFKLHSWFGALPLFLHDLEFEFCYYEWLCIIFWQLLYPNNWMEFQSKCNETS